MSEYWNAMVPELSVSDLEESLAFYLCLGFKVRFKRDNPPFVYLEMGKAQIMLEEIHDDAWSTGDLERPFGRGVNFQIETDSAQVMQNTAQANNLKLYEAYKESWYTIEEDYEEGQIEFLLQDPDGYLLRFIEPLGSRKSDV